MADAQLRGRVQVINQRHLQFEMLFPGGSGERAQFCWVRGEINSRSKSITLSPTPLIEMSFHTLQRLLERLQTRNASLALDEIYSCIGLITVWREAAMTVNAQSFPLVSSNGFFVTSTNGNEKGITLITWMHSCQLGNKWADVVNSFIAVKEQNSRQIASPTFVQSFLRSFPWMLHEHVPMEDLETLAWEQRERSEHSEVRDTYPFANTDYSHPPSLLEMNPSKKHSVSYHPGLNYRDLPPEFKLFSTHQGIVIRAVADGHLIGISGGWIGKISAFTTNKVLAAGLSVPDVRVGDEIGVTVQKILKHQHESAFHISLLQTEVDNARWIRIEKTYPVGITVTGQITRQLPDGSMPYLVQLDNFTWGLVPAEDLLLFQIANDSNPSCSKFATQFVVVGHDADRRNITLAIPNAKDNYINLVSKTLKIGSKVEGKITGIKGPIFQVRTSHGFIGSLLDLNCIGHEDLSIGSEVRAVVIHIDEEWKLILGAVSPSELDKQFYVLPKSSERWKQFTELHQNGQTVKVQVRKWDRLTRRFFVATECGHLGRIELKDVGWEGKATDPRSKFSVGEIVEAKILKIDSDKNRLTLSIRELIPHPLESAKSFLSVNQRYSGVVTTAHQYGYFVLLPFGAQGLLHKSMVPEGLEIKVKDLIDVYILNFDIDAKKVSLSITPLQ